MYIDGNKNDDLNEIRNTLLYLFLQLEKEDAKVCLFQQTLLLTSRKKNGLDKVISFVSPILTAGLITVPETSHIPNVRLNSCLQRYSRTMSRSNKRYVKKLLLMQYNLLVIYIKANIGDEEKIDYLIDWVEDILETSMSFVEDRDFVMKSIPILLEIIFPVTSGYSNLCVVLQSFIRLLSSIDFQFNEKNLLGSVLSTLSVFRLGVSLLSSPNEDEIDLWLQICVILCAKGSNSLPLECSRIFWVLGCIFSTSSIPSSSQNAKKMIESVYSKQIFDEDLQSYEKNPDLMSIISNRSLSSYISNFSTTSLPSTWQSALLLCASIYTISSSNRNKYDRVCFATQILVKYPSLNIRFFPVAISLLSAQYSSNSCKVLDILTLLCKTSTKDAHSTRQLWHFLHNTLPPSLKGTVIRLYPFIHRSNPRTFSKIAAELVTNSQYPSAEIRLAVASTINDICKQENSSSVEEFIGVIQTYIQPDKFQDDSISRTLTMSLAIQSLHHLCQNGTLEYRIMYKVLKNRMGWKWKRLCDTDDIGHLLASMDLIVLQDLILLLGNGEPERMSEKEEQLTRYKINIQIEDSVRFLVFLGTNLYPKNFDMSEFSIIIIPQVIEELSSTICKSLNKYSLDALGLDASDDLVHYWKTKNSDISDEKNEMTDTINRYLALCNIIMFNLMSLTDNSSPKLKEGAIQMTSKLLKMEEDLIGKHSMWKKNKRIKEKKKNQFQSHDNKLASKSQSSQIKLTIPEEILDILPSSKKLSHYYWNDPNGASAAALLVSFSVQEANINGMVEKVTNIIADLATKDDMLQSSTMRLLTVWTYVATAQQLWFPFISSSGTSKGNFDNEAKDKDSVANTLVQQISSIKDNMQYPDHALMLLASLSVIMLKDGDLDFLSILKTIDDEVWYYFENSLFSNDDNAFTCLGMVGVCHVRNKSWTVVDKIIKEVGRSLQENFGEQDQRERKGATTTRTNYFGGYISLGILAQHIGYEIGNENKSRRNDAQKRYQIIVGIMLNELMHMAYSTPPPSLSEFVSIVKKNKDVAPDFEKKLERSLQNAIVNVKERSLSKFKSLSLSLGLCISSLKHRPILSRCAIIVFRYTKLWPALSQLMLSISVETSSKSNLRQELRLLLLDNSKSCYNIGEMLLALAYTNCGIENDTHQELQEHNEIVDICFKFLHEFQSYASSRDRVNIILASCTAVLCFPFHGNEDISFFDMIRIHSRTETRQISQLIQALNQIIEIYIDDEESCAMAMIAIGSLSSIKMSSGIVPQRFRMKHSLLESKDLKMKKTNETLQRNSKIKSFPFAKYGTLHNYVVFSMQSLIEKDMTSEINRLMPSLLLSLQKTSLPESFASILESLLNMCTEIRADFNDVKFACIRVLVNQIKNGRRGISSDNTFVNLHIRLSSSCITEFKTLGEREIEEFMSSFAYCLPRYPSSAVKESILCAWKLCSIKMHHNETCGIKLAVTLLNSIIPIFQNTSRKAEKDGRFKLDKTMSVSTEVISILSNIIANEIFLDLSRIIQVPPINPHNHEIDHQKHTHKYGYLSILWNAFLLCLNEVPLPVLEEHGFFTKEVFKDEKQLLLNLFRVNAVTFLASKAYFNHQSADRGAFEVDKMRSWLSRQIKSNTENILKHSLQTTALNVVKVNATNLLKEHCRDYILSGLEVILVYGFKTMCLEVLALQVTFWYIQFTKQTRKSRLIASCFNGIESLSSHSIFLVPQECSDCRHFVETDIKYIIDACLHDMPMRLAFICRELEITSKVFTEITRICEVYENELESAANLRILKETRLYCLCEDSIKMKYVLSVSEELSK